MSIVRHIDFHAAHGFAASTVTGKKSDYVDPAVAVSKPLNSEVRGVGSNSIRVRRIVGSVVCIAVAAVVMPMGMMMLAEPVR